MRRFAWVFLLGWLLSLPLARHRNLKDCGGSSRMATVESLVERGTFAIDGSTFAYTCDVMKREGRLYSDKPPLLSVAAAGIYLVVHRVGGLSFNREADPHRNALHDHCYALMIVLVVGVAHALLVAGCDLAAGSLGLRGARRALATATVAFATPHLPLLALFNSHTVAAALLFGGFYAAWVREPARPLGAGLALGAAAAVDLPLGGSSLALASLLPPGGARGRLRLAAGAAPPLGLHGLLNWWIVGDLVPFQMHRELYDDVTGHAGASATGFAQDAGIAFYAVRNLVGSLGVFSLTPIAGLALFLVLREALRRGPRARLARIAAGLFLAALGLYVVVWPQAVGCAYGMRHVVPVLPPLLLVGASAAGSRAWRAWVGLAVVSGVLAAGGLLSPATCSGFVEDARGLVPARVFFRNLKEELLPGRRYTPGGGPGAG